MNAFRTLAACLLMSAAPFAVQAEENGASGSAKTQVSGKQSSTETADSSTKKKGSTKKKAAVKNAGNANCPVGGSPVGSMQAGSHIVYKGYKVGLCCDGCKGRFMQDPDTYLRKALGK